MDIVDVLQHRNIVPILLVLYCLHRDVIYVFYCSFLELLYSV